MQIVSGVTGSFPALAFFLLLANLTGCCSNSRAFNASQQWIRTELYFGQAKPQGGLVSESEWESFLDQSVTPRFPNGFTVVHAQGRYLMSDQTLQKEPAQMLIILHPESSSDAETKIAELVHEYIHRFNQESVLRSDSAARSALITESK